jgi:cytochrome c biogenesis protein CcmG/thiol:disulfide interchange protein DsbE
MSAINLGVYGIPETFLVDRNGIVINKYIGPITRIEVDEIKSIFAENL